VSALSVHLLRSYVCVCVCVCVCSKPDTTVTVKQKPLGKRGRPSGGGVKGSSVKKKAVNPRGGVVSKKPRSDVDEIIRVWGCGSCVSIKLAFVVFLVECFFSSSNEKAVR